MPRFILAQPGQWTLMVTGTVRNPWRDLWIRRASNEYWTHAREWRNRYAAGRHLHFIDRRRLARRSSD